MPTAVAEQTTGVPETFRLHGNWPNPFNASTTIAFDVERTAPVHLVVYDVLGRRVRTLHGGETLTAGHYRTAWNGRDDEGRPAASGVYLYRLIARGRILLRWGGWPWFARTSARVTHIAILNDEVERFELRIVLKVGASDRSPLQGS